MNVQFFMCQNNDVDTVPVFDASISYKERSEQQLTALLQHLTSLVQQASSCPQTVFPVVFCAEDFFRGAKISTKDEEENKTGQCCDRDIAYRFIANELTQLSKKYPNVLIIPGSIYVNVIATFNTSLYLQNTSKRPGALYVQSIAPVLHDGQVIRLVKKGDYLKLTGEKVGAKEKRKVETSAEHLKALEKEYNFTVMEYHEDDLDDMNSGLVFFGKTPLPGEETLLTSLHLNSPSLFDNTFSVKGIKFGLEICGDHARGLLEGCELDYHLVSSDGIGPIYNACDDMGYRVQIDADSDNLTSVSTSTEDYPLEVVNATDAHVKYRKTPPLVTLRLESDEELHQTIHPH